jgi:REP element-mobilizing transposase RayT
VSRQASRKGDVMRRVSSLSHTRWECKYHVVFIPKYRRKVLFGKRPACTHYSL